MIGLIANATLDFSITFFYIIIIVVDFMPVIRSKKKVPIFIYAFCLLSTYIVHILVALNITVWSPAIPIRNIITDIFNVK